MKRLTTLILLFFLAILITGTYVGLWRPSEALPPVLTTELYDYAGVINVHTNKSSGSGDTQTIAKIANATQLDFIILTDVNDFSPNTEQDGYFENTLLLTGGEYSYLGGRILNFNFQNKDHLVGVGRTQTLFTEVLSRPSSNHNLGTFVVAHPLREGYKLNTLPAGIDGIEIFNLKNILQNTWSNSKLSIFWSLLIYPFNRELAFIRMLPHSYDSETEYWDSQNLSRQLIGYSGLSADAKLRISKTSHWEFPPYEILFQIARNHILTQSELTGNSEKDRGKVFEALSAGNFYIGLDIISPTKGFKNYISQQNNIAIKTLPGSVIKFTEGLEMSVVLPYRPSMPFEIVIFKDGDAFMSSTSPHTVIKIHSAGVYRAEVRLKVALPLPDGNKWIRWIVSNPFFVK